MGRFGGGRFGRGGANTLPTPSILPDGTLSGVPAGALVVVVNATTDIRTALTYPGGSLWGLGLSVPGDQVQVSRAGASSAPSTHPAPTAPVATPASFSRSWTVGVPVPAFTFASYFNRTDLTFALSPANASPLPIGMTIAASGAVAGFTPTEAFGGSIVVRGTSPEGLWADITLVASIVEAPSSSLTLSARGVDFQLTGVTAAGYYANGDPWVNQGATLVAASPASAPGQDATVRHGAMWKPLDGVAGDGGAAPRHGFDGRIKGSTANATAPTTFLPSLNVDPGYTGAAFAPAAPGVLLKGVSVLGAVPEDGGGQRGANALQRYVPLTFVAASPATGELRPPVRGGAYISGAGCTLAKVEAAVDAGWFQSIDMTALADHSAAARAERLGRVRATVQSFTSYWNHLDTLYTRDSFAGYGRNFCRDVGFALRDLHSTIPRQDKIDLLLGLCQMGRDLYGFVADGGWWTENGGWMHGRMDLVLLAGLVFGDAFMTSAVLTPVGTPYYPGRTSTRPLFSEQTCYQFGATAARTDWGRPAGWGAYVGSGGATHVDRGRPTRQTLPAEVVGVPMWNIGPYDGAWGNCINPAQTYGPINVYSQPERVFFWRKFLGTVDLSSFAARFGTVDRYMRYAKAYYDLAFEASALDENPNWLTNEMKDPRSDWYAAQTMSRYVGPPEQALPPLSLTATGTDIAVVGKADAIDNGSPVTRRDRRWSQDGGATWTVLTDVPKDQTIAVPLGLTQTLVQDRFVNALGVGPWSTNLPRFTNPPNDAMAANLVSPQAVVTTGVAAPTTITVDSASLGFPDGNRDGQAVAAPAYVADGAIWAPSGNRIFDPASDSAFLALVEVPWERMQMSSPSSAGILGNAAGSGSNAQTLGIYAERDVMDQVSPGIRFRLKDNAGVAFNVKVNVAIDQRRLLLAIRMVAGQLLFEVYHRGVLVGSQAPAMSTWAAMQLRSQLIYGAMGSGSGSAYVSNSGIISGFPGSLAFVGYRDGGLSQADCEAISLGADPLVQSTAAAWRMYRRLRGTDAASLAKPAEATGDATASMIVSNARSLVFRNGGDLAPARAGSTWFGADAIHDGRVFARLAGEATGRVFLSGTWAGLSGGIEARIYDAADGRIRRDWTALSGVVSDASTWSGYLDSPPNDGWGHIDIRPASTPALVQRIRARTGVGQVHVLDGQSQVERAVTYGVANIAPVAGARAVSGAYITSRQTPDAIGGTYGTVLGVVTPEWRMSDGLVAVANWLAEIDATREPVMILGIQKSGSSPEQYLDDANAGRNWSETEGILNRFLGPLARRRIGAYVINWLTSFANDAPANRVVGYNLQPLFLGTRIDTGEAWPINHYVRDGLTFPLSTRIGLSPPTRNMSLAAGPFDASDAAGDNSVINHGRGRKQSVDWALANPSLIAAVGPWTDDLDMASTGNGSGGPHQNASTYEGVARTLPRMVECALRAVGLVTRTDPFISGASIDAGRTAITVAVTRPRGQALQTAWAIKGVTPPVGGTTVQGFEVQDGGAGAWSRSGFTAEIAGNAVVLTKASGTWAAGTLVRYAANGPLSYGTATDADRLFNGMLYEAGPDEGGLGIPVAGLWSSGPL